MKKTNLFYLLLLGLMLHAFSVSYGQEKEQTLGYLQTKANAPLLKITRTSRDVNLSDGKVETTYIDELIINNQRNSFAGGERYEGYAQNVILTSLVKPNTNERFLQSYILEGNSVKKLAKLGIDEFTSARIHEDSKNIILTDQWENLGYKAELYTPMFKKITSYSPFVEKGYEYFLSEFGKNIMVYIFFPLEKESNAKLVAFDARSGKVSFEVSLDSHTYNISKLIVKGDYIFIKQNETPEKQELLCYDSKGNLIWKQAEYIRDIAVIKNDGKAKVLSMNNTNYWIIDAETGKSTEKKMITDFTNGEKLGDNLWVDLSTTENDSKFVMMVSKRDPVESSTYLYNMFLFNGTENIYLKKKTFVSQDGSFYLAKVNSKLLIVNSNNQIIDSHEN